MDRDKRLDDIKKERERKICMRVKTVPLTPENGFLCIFLIIDQ